MKGTIISGRYRLDDHIGHGGFGDVYSGFDLQLKRPVAVKVLSEGRQDVQMKEKFRREAENVARLRHPNIVNVFDAGEDNGRAYLVMELIEGPPLLDLCDKLATDMLRLLKIAESVCDAMHHAHEVGLIHRDLTLKNIMVEGGVTPRILDFGLAKRVRVDTQSNSRMIVGTPFYMAPEQAAGKVVDGRVDVFSFGVCLYRVLAGRFPFEAEHPTAVVYMICNDSPPPLPRHVPVALQDVVLRCLEKEPTHRFQTFAEVKAALAAMDCNQVAASALSSTTTGLDAGVRGPHNPYLNRVMIKNPDDFFGRQKEVKRIYSRLDAARPQSVSVVGERRMGKSSLLNYLYHRRNRRLNMQNHRESIFLYMDFQRIQDVNTEKFIDILFSMMTFELGEEISATSGVRSLEMLDAAIERLNQRGLRVIVLMDEFEAITNNPRFDMQFFSFLRYLANNYKVAYVTSSYSDLQQMCHDRDIADSPFFNIFSTLQLRPFSRDEAMELIRVPSEREGIPLHGFAERIIALSGYFPLFIQVACSSAYELLADDPAAEPDWKEITRVFTEEAEPHFAFVWGRMEEVVRENLRRVATGQEVDRRFVHVNEELVRRGYLLEGSDGLGVFSEPFRRFVLAQTAQIEPGPQSGWRKWLGRK